MKTRTIVIVLVLVCGGLMTAFVLLCAGLMFAAFRNIDAELSPQLDKLFAAIDNGTFGETYATDTTPELRNAISQEEYEQLGFAIKTRLGTLESRSLRQFNVRQFNAATYADVVYTASFERGKGAIRARFKKEFGRWRLVSFHVSSPEFQQDLVTKTCPSCGQPHAAAAKFCPNCGQRVTESGLAASDSADAKQD